MPTYSIGLNHATWILSWVASACFLIGIYALVKAILMYERTSALALAVLSLVIFPVATVLSLFPFVFSTVNLVTQQMSKVSFWRTEIA